MKIVVKLISTCKTATSFNKSLIYLNTKSYAYNKQLTCKEVKIAGLQVSFLAKNLYKRILKTFTNNLPKQTPMVIPFEFKESSLKPLSNKGTIYPFFSKLGNFLSIRYY